MSPITKSALVAIGAAIGGVCRYWTSVLVNEKIASSFPWSTFLINSIGSVLIGLVVGRMMSSGDWETQKLLIVVGILGGFTTFSAFSIEIVELFSRSQLMLGLVYALGTCVVGVLGCFAGFTIGKSLI